MKTLLTLLLAGLLAPSLVLAEVSVKPFGFVLVNASYNSDAVVDIPVTAPLDDTGEVNFLITPRQTRLGFAMKSDAQGGPSGAIEIDFWGLRGSGSNGGPTQSAPRLRRAFMKLHAAEKVDLIAGQEWVAFAPLNPASLMHASIPAMSSSGNLWARLPQVQGMFKLSDAAALQLALSRPLGGEATMTPVLQADVLGAGEKGELPWLQGRLTLGQAAPAGVVLGVSGQVGRLDFGKDPTGDEITAISMAVAGDVFVKRGRLTLSGEAFMGKNLPTFFSNASYATKTQGDTVGGALRDIEEVSVMGGWGELKLSASPKLDFAVSLGMESVDDENLTAGKVKENLTVLGAVIVKAAEAVQVGTELGYVSTTYQGTGDGTSLNGNVSFMFSF